MKRLECLDGLRGVLAVYVMLGHMAPFAVLPGWFQGAVGHGGAAVDLFFVLSGLVITQSLKRTGGCKLAFLSARAMRIFPVFLPVFAVAAIMQPWSCGFSEMPWIGPNDAARTICTAAWPDTAAVEIAAHVTMIHGLFPNAILPNVWISFLGSAWSLSAEWQFYVLAILLAAGGKSRLIRVLLALAAAGVVWHVAMPEPAQFSRAFLPNKAHFFALGVASEPVVRLQPGALRRYGIVLAITLGVCATQAPLGKMIPPLAWTVCLAIQMFPAVPVLRQANQLLRSRVAQFGGAISYCLYVVNEPVHKPVSVMLSRVADGDAVLYALLWVPLSILLPISVAVWLHVYLEMPALRLGRRMM